MTTLHGRLDIPNLRNLFREFSDEPIVSISNYQRRPLPWACWRATIYHGLPVDLYRFHQRSGNYLAFLGRVSPEKRLEDAIQIACRSGVTLKIAAKIDKADQDYFDTIIKPLLKRPDIEFIGEIGETEKNEFLGNALALLFPIEWPEPFGLVMIEALACGTPVIARARGSVPEIIEDGVTGFFIDNLEQGVRAVQRLGRLNRQQCRQAFEKRFTAARMASDYVAFFEQLVRANLHRKIQPGLTTIDKKPSAIKAGPDCPPDIGAPSPALSSNE